MRKCLFVASALALSGCATQPKYTIIPDTQASQEKVKDDLFSCRMETARARNKGAGFLMVFGAIGGAVAGAMDAAGNDKPPEQMTDECMERRGYKRDMSAEKTPG